MKPNPPGVQGLDKHGRDWKRIGEHIGTRDARAVASHAQKHFIRLLIAGAWLAAQPLATQQSCSKGPRLRASRILAGWAPEPPLAMPPPSAGEPMPEAVSRSGAGYTLSGALLNPYAAAAASYGFTPSLLLSEPPGAARAAPRHT